LGIRDILEARLVVEDEKLILVRWRCVSAYATRRTV